METLPPSKFRRVTCTALAWIAFFALAWKGYWLGSDATHSAPPLPTLWVLLPPGLAVAPVLLLSLAVYDPLRVFRSGVAFDSHPRQPSQRHHLSPLPHTLDLGAPPW